LETLQLSAEFRERLCSRIPVLQPVVWVTIAAAICAGRPESRKSLNPMADLSDAEYRRRYELGRRRYYAERAERWALRKAWIRDHGPWLLLAVIAVLLVAVLGLTQPHRFIVITTLALYCGLAWLVCWAVRHPLDS
jgi:Flp pilus assembly protein TadB